MSIILKVVNVKNCTKDHQCNACLWLVNIGNTPESIFNQIDMTEDEKRYVIKAHANKWKVKKGEPAIYCAGITDGDFGTWYSIPEIHDICMKYDIYCE